MGEEMENWAQVALHVVADTIESTAFTEVQESEDIPVYNDQVAVVSLLAHDPLQGEFLFFMEQGLLKHLADIVYGPLFGEVSEQNEQDFLAELLNTIAGRFLSDILSDDESFRLGIPEPASKPNEFPPLSARCFHFVIEGLFLSLCVSGESLLALSSD